jgi:hypothetical protein
MVEDGNVTRITTRTEAGRAAIERCGAECFIGTPDRLGTLIAALENVTIVCWLLASATGSRQDLLALHGPRLQAFLEHAVDTTMRGFIYEAGGTTVPAEALAEGRRIVAEVSDRNAIPFHILMANPADSTAWVGDARAAVHRLLAST